MKKIHFEDYSGKQFEYLVYAYMARSYPWISLEWLGRAGSEGGRDIWGVRFAGYDDNGHIIEKKVCIQCKNVVDSTGPKSIEKELDKVKNHVEKQVDEYWLVGSRTSDYGREKIRKYAKKHNNIETVKFLDAEEFEEHLWRDTPSLARRFLSGIPFTTDMEEILSKGEHDLPPTMTERLARLRPIFHRNAFRLPMRNELSAYTFMQAIQGTQRALLTGSWVTNEGTKLGTVPNLSDFDKFDNYQVLVRIDGLLTDLHKVAAEIFNRMGLAPMTTSKSKLVETGDLFVDYCNLADSIREEIEQCLVQLYPDFKGLPES
ncbi:restriction endonuclease [Photobacterium leiognathi]|uniref:restriction endonuclease n=1 Tax=Photobacterium leiognathi TaxID=553611 RepID=UPI00298171EB|nr:restriction endonuclease [Photobacterium leiognathi]